MLGLLVFYIRCRKKRGGDDKRKTNDIRREEAVIYASIEPTRDNHEAAANGVSTGPKPDVIYSELQASDT